MNLDGIWQEAETRYPWLAAHKPLKTPELLRFYEQLFTTDGPFEKVVELGIYRGGSIVLWNEALHPAKLVGIDLDPEREEIASALGRYLEATASGERVRTYWRTAQHDAERIPEIARQEFEGAIDLVIDDCSHIYTPTRLSFLMLFPLLRSGGAYVIEDWGTDRLPDFHDPAGTMIGLLREMIDFIYRGEMAVADVTINASCALIRKR